MLESVALLEAGRERAFDHGTMKSMLTFSANCDRRVSLMPELVEVPGDEFWMGCEAGRADENPVHRVCVDAFAMGSTTVTNRQYQAFAQATGEAMPPAFNDACFNDPHQPVVGVTWFNAMAYCDWLSREMGVSFRLPTEAAVGTGCSRRKGKGPVCLGQ